MLRRRRQRAGARVLGGENSGPGPAGRDPCAGPDSGRRVLRFARGRLQRAGFNGFKISRLCYAIPGRKAKKEILADRNYPLRQAGTRYDWLRYPKEVAHLHKRRRENILGYQRQRITSAASESIHSKIRWVKYIAGPRGFRNKKNLQTAIHFHRGGLDMAPSCH